jgi:16S rRNA G966 N2-methylase RsmD
MIALEMRRLRHTITTNAKNAVARNQHGASYITFLFVKPPFAKSFSALVAMSLVLHHKVSNGERQLKAAAAD